MSYLLPLIKKRFLAKFPGPNDSIEPLRINIAGLNLK